MGDNLSQYHVGYDRAIWTVPRKTNAWMQITWLTTTWLSCSLTVRTKWWTRQRTKIFYLLLITLTCTAQLSFLFFVFISELSLKSLWRLNLTVTLKSHMYNVNSTCAMKKYTLLLTRKGRLGSVGNAACGYFRGLKENCSRTSLHLKMICQVDLARDKSGSGRHRWLEKNLWNDSDLQKRGEEIAKLMLRTFFTAGILYDKSYREFGAVPSVTNHFQKHGLW